METRLYLMAAMVIVGCGCLGLLVVRISNPFLKGLGWLAASFACGVVSTSLLCLNGHLPRFYTDIIANIFSDLLPYLFLHAAILELTGSKRRFSPVGAIVIVIWIPGTLILTYLHDSHPLRVELGSALLGVLAFQSGLRLIRRAEKGVRVPAYFTGIVLFAFVLFNVIRAGMAARYGLSDDILAPSNLQIVSIIIYLTAPLGFAFGLFWMSTAKLRLSVERLASIDPLLGISNRRSFRNACERALTRCLSDGETLSLLIADIDHFKRVNDQYGHLIGDAVLCAVAANLQAHLRPFDLLGRWGGEEFVILLPDCPSPIAMQVAERLRQGVEAWTEPGIIPAGPAIRTTISLGVATFQGTHDALEDLFRRADNALYQAKELGRNRVADSE